MKYGILGSGFGIYGWLSAIFKENDKNKVFTLEKYKSKILSRIELKKCLKIITFVKNEKEIFEKSKAIIIAKNAENIVASIVALGITRELGPVIAGLMLAGRVSASISAEIATMRVTEQIDALITLSTNPMKYLVVPRVLAAVISLPILVIIADIIGIMGGFVVGTKTLGFIEQSYIKNTLDIIELRDVLSGLVKAAVFGFIVAFMGGYHGYNSTGGAQGVGRSTTLAVVSASILILASNYILTSLVFTN